jgi:hypothetical protein
MGLVQRGVVQEQDFAVALSFFCLSCKRFVLPTFLIPFCMDPVDLVSFPASIICHVLTHISVW